METWPCEPARLHDPVEPEEADTLDARAAPLDDAVAAPAPQGSVHNHRPAQQAADEEGADEEEVVYKRCFCVLLTHLLHRSRRLL